MRNLSHGGFEMSHEGHAPGVPQVDPYPERRSQRIDDLDEGSSPTKGSAGSKAGSGRLALGKSPEKGGSPSAATRTPGLDRDAHMQRLTSQGSFHMNHQGG